MRHELVLLSIALTGIACATTSSTERLEASAAAIRSAEEIGAQNIPQANLHLQLAKEQSQHAKQLIEAGGDKEEAASLLARAEVDAELARALAREDSTRTQAQQAIDRVKTINQTNQ
jgi:hypothetical protein